MACEARHAPTGPPGRTCALRTHGPPQRRLPLCPLRFFVSFVVNPFWQSACASTPLICSKSVNYRRSFERSEETSAVPLATCFVYLRGPSCTFVSAPQGKPSTHSHRPARRPAGAFQSANQLISGAATLPLWYTVGKEFGHGRREDCARDL